MTASLKRRTPAGEGKGFADQRRSKRHRKDSTHCAAWRDWGQP